MINRDDMDIAQRTSHASSQAVEISPDMINLRELVSNLWIERWWVGGITAAVFALALAYALLATPIYQSDVLLQVESSQGPLSGLQNITEMLGATPPADSEIQIIRSRSVLLAAVQAQHLDIQVTPDVLPVIGRLWANPDAQVTVTRLEVPTAWMDASLSLRASGGKGFALYDPDGKQILEGEAGKAADADVQTGQGPGHVSIFVAGLTANAGDGFSVRKLYSQEVYDELDEDLNVSEQGKDSGILEMTLEGRKPEQITDILNAIADNYLKQNVERQSQQAAQSLKFIEGQLPSLKEQVDTAASALSEYRSHKGSVDMSLEAQSLMKQGAEVDTALSQLDLKRSELAQQFTANHPVMIALNSKQQDLHKEKDRIEAQIKNLPLTEQKAVQLMRNVTVANDLYTALLNKAQELKVAKAGTVGNVRIIDRALVPLKPVKPKKRLVVVLGLVLGFMLGAFFVFLRQALTHTLSDPDQVEEQLGLPLYAVVPFSEHQAKAESAGRNVACRYLLAREQMHDPAIESMRSLRTSLQFAMPTAQGRIIALTGPTPEVGKSFVAVNLACILAQGGSRTLLIDADLHRGRQHRFFGGTREPGLSQILSGDIAYADAIRKTDIEKLDMIATGIIPPNASELFMHPRMRELLSRAEADYDYVLLDTPPVLAVSEAVVLTALASHTFLIMRSGEHSAREMHVCLKRLERIDAHVRGLVLNGFRARDSERYGYSYGYQYDYK